MDSTLPGDWTVVIYRNNNDNVTGITIDYWPARKLEFLKTGEAKQSVI